jgi:DNA-binding response OmpR family regulator
MMEKTVLVVEENEALLDVLTKTLIRHGYDVVGAQNGLAALTIPPEKDIDLVVLDKRLSIVDGARTAARLRRAEHSNYLPVLLLVPKDQVSAEESLDLHGADTFIHIPTDAENLVRKIRDLLEEKEARDKARDMLRAKVRQDLEQNVEEIIRDTFQDKTERMLSDLSKGLVEMLETQAREELRARVTQISDEEFAARINELVDEFTRPLVEEVGNEVVTRLSSDILEERVAELTRRFEKDQLPALINGAMQKATDNAHNKLVESVQNDVKETIVSELLQSLPSLMDRMANRTFPLAAEKYLPELLDKKVTERVNQELTTKGKKIVERQVLQDVRRIGLKRISRYIFFGLFFSVIALSAAVAALIKYAPEWLPKVPLP